MNLKGTLNLDAISYPDPTQTLKTFWISGMTTLTPRPRAWGRVKPEISVVVGPVHIYIKISLYLSLSLCLCISYQDTTKKTSFIFLHYSKFARWSNKGEDLMWRISRLFAEWVCSLLKAGLTLAISYGLHGICDDLVHLQHNQSYIGCRQLPVSYWINLWKTEK